MYFALQPRTVCATMMVMMLCLPLFEFSLVSLKGLVLMVLMVLKEVIRLGRPPTSPTHRAQPGHVHGTSGGRAQRGVLSWLHGVRRASGRGFRVSRHRLRHVL